VLTPALIESQTRIGPNIQKFLMSLLIYGKLLDQPNVAPREDRGHAFVSTDRKKGTALVEKTETHILV